jgi:hypothetical protein
MACVDCQKDAQKKAIIGAAGGALLGAGVAILVLRYVRSR